MKNVLILGYDGMLGSMVYDFLSWNNNLNLALTYFNTKIETNIMHRDFLVHFLDASGNPQERLHLLLSEINPDYIINCIGIIKPYCRDDDRIGVLRAIEVNARFPHLLSDLSWQVNPKTRIIQIATDCVFDGIKGRYCEDDLHNALDVYGKTKSLGEVKCNNFLNIRCSIIGPELYNKLSLFEWFLAHNDKDKVIGYDHHIWNGVTTLQFAQFCEKIIINDLFDAFVANKSLIHLVTNDSVSKYKLLNILNNVFNRDIQIELTNEVGDPIDRSLTSTRYPIDVKPMEYAIMELKQYLMESKLYNKSSH